MKVPLSWLKEYIEITLDPHEIARLLTFAGLEVESINFIGLPQPDQLQNQTSIYGLEWDRNNIIVADINKVEHHPNADRLVLAQLYDGEVTHTVLTGAPNLFQYKDQGELAQPLKVAYAREGAQLYDGHNSNQELITIKRKKIRGVESYSMACSEKELGISDEHEGIIVFDSDAPKAGTPLVDYIGDAVFDIAITPNMARNLNILGVARELGALTKTPINPPTTNITISKSIQSPLEMPKIEIAEPELNPRFTATLIENIQIKPSPYWMQLRLRMSGMRPINNVVDITNYVMLETGQPLHAFDYDVLRNRSETKVPVISTRLPKSGEKIVTLDGINRNLDDFTILVADNTGALSIGGIMGGSDSEVSDDTKNILLEAASWDLINIRQTVTSQQMQSSQAGYRFSRGVSPEIAASSNHRAAEMIRSLGNGKIIHKFVDKYPRHYVPNTVKLPIGEIQRSLGVDIPTDEVVSILIALDFTVEQKKNILHVTAPSHRLDIGIAEIGIADIIEEIARIWGFENIPETQISDLMPRQENNTLLEKEEKIRDILVNLGLQEVITYRISSPENEQLLHPIENGPYVHLANPITPERSAMRRSLLSSVLECAQDNLRFQQRIALFEVGPVYLPELSSSNEQSSLPLEAQRLSIVLSGQRLSLSWINNRVETMDYFDLKGIIDQLIQTAHISNYTIDVASHPAFQAGAVARLTIDGSQAGLFGVLHPDIASKYDLREYPTLAADFDLMAFVDAMPDHYSSNPIPRFPAIIEDIALIVDDRINNAEVVASIVKSGGATLTKVQLFDLFRGEQIGANKKSLAYRLTYQSEVKTLTDKDAAKLRNKIVKTLQKELGAQLRSE
ncbi:MAG: phenylalanine--tRNA ligase subunit beta [Anaerolineaceae bacterium]|nr:phenylalanine--tRNA ligase subunit beta [Anaerolineaceae bacterium]